MLTINPDTLTDTQAEAAINYILTLRPDCLGADEDPNKEWTQKTFTVPVGSITSGQSTPVPSAVVNEAPEVTAEDAGAPDFDSAGYPWDERIHAGSRATVADGTWRKKRGVSDELVAEVEAELATVREQSATEAPSAPEQDQEVPEAPVGEPASAPVADAPSPSPDSVDGAGGSDAPPPPPAAPANPFLAVMSRIGKSKLDKAKKDELLTAAGALDDKGNPSILVLNKRPELIDGFVALLDSEGV